jgi:hypothetical protein
VLTTLAQSRQGPVARIGGTRSTTGQVTADPQDFGHLGPMVRAVRDELENVGVAESLGVVIDAGYWHGEQMDEHDRRSDLSVAERPVGP